MNDKKLDLILSKMQNVESEVRDVKGEVQDMKTEMQVMKTEMQVMKTEMQDVKTEMQVMKTEMQDVKTEMQDVKHRVTNMELHFENATDRNIQLIAENFIELTKKLNQAIPVADKNLAYEVKVSYLIEEVDKLKENVEEIRKQVS
ncbi:MAG: hypothetical protein NC318_02535 [Blautia sp.]|nr:hypothetical protein [Lachnoclostridium sp.]MCM1210459.1 hypothetical protein [Blautia sp.]